MPESVAVGHYVGVLSASNAALRDAVNDILRAAMRDGTLERILRKWGVWNEDQAALQARVLNGEPVEPFRGVELTFGRDANRGGTRRRGMCRHCSAHPS